MGGRRLWLLWRVLNWRRDWFVATDKRFLLFYGFIRRRVAMMPLLKVTDMTYDRSILGRIFGYGKFVLESAGQDQALSTIDHVPDADTHYHAICTQLFGPGLDAALRPRAAPPPQPPRDDDGPDGGGGGGPTDGPDAGGPAPAGARAEPRRGRRATAEPDQRPRVVVPQLEPAAARCTSATPARSRSCGCRATTRGARSTRRRTGPTGADRTSSLAFPASARRRPPLASVRSMWGSDRGGGHP